MRTKIGPKVDFRLKGGKNHDSGTKRVAKAKFSTSIPNVPSLYILVCLIYSYAQVICNVG
jgi:hypothetical protein